MRSHFFDGNEKKKDFEILFLDRFEMKLWLKISASQKN